MLLVKAAMQSHSRTCLSQGPQLSAHHWRRTPHLLHHQRRLTVYAAQGQTGTDFARYAQPAPAVDVHPAFALHSCAQLARTMVCLLCRLHTELVWLN